MAADFEPTAGREAASLPSSKARSSAASEPPFEPKVRVQLVGLQDRPELNRASGTVEDFDTGLQRWKVRLDQGGMKLFRQGNLRRLAPAEEQGKTPATGTTAQRRPTQERPGSRGTPPEILPELSGPAPAGVGPGASTASEDKNLNWQASMERRFAGLEGQLKEMSTTISDQQVLIHELLSRADFDELGDASEKKDFKMELESFRTASDAAIKKLQAQTNAAVSRLSRVEDRLRHGDDSLSELRSQVGLLQDCLERQNVLPSWTILAGVHRQRFKATCKTSGWRGEASATDVLRQEQVTIRLFGFAGPTDVLAMQSLSKSSAVGATSHKVQMQCELQSALAAAQSDPGGLESWSLLKSTIQEAEAADVDSQQIRMAQEIWASGRAKAVVGKSGSREELSAALRAAKQAGISEAELRRLESQARPRIDELERVGEAQRKLRIVVSWASSQNVAKLRTAIDEAKEVGVDSDDVAKAERELSNLLPSAEQPAAKREPPNEPRQPKKSRQPAAGLSDLLRAAKPLWTARDLEGAVLKLGCVGIVSVRGLASVLAADAATEHSLNELLKKAGQKTFTEGTVKSLRAAVGNFRQPVM